MDEYVSIDMDEPEEFAAEPQLAGYGLEALDARVAKLERENKALKALLQAAGAEVSDDGMLSVSSSDGDTPFELPVVREGDELADVDFDEQFLRSFRAAMEKVETERRQERVVDGLNRQLDRLGVELNDSQRDSVIESTMGFREKTRSLWRELPRGSDDESRESRRQAFEAVREEYSTTIFNLVPSAEAEKIVEGMGRGIGFSSRRGDGMGGGRRGNR